MRQEEFNRMLRVAFDDPEVVRSVAPHIVCGISDCENLASGIVETRAFKHEVGELIDDYHKEHHHKEGRKSAM